MWTSTFSDLYTVLAYHDQHIEICRKMGEGENLLGKPLIAAGGNTKTGAEVGVTESLDIIRTFDYNASWKLLHNEA